MAGHKEVKPSPAPTPSCAMNLYLRASRILRNFFCVSHLIYGIAAQVK